MSLRNYNILILFLALFLHLSCKSPTSSDDTCASGFLPCNDNLNECCPVVCDQGYHLGGPDSTICLPDTSNHQFTWQIHEIGDFSSYARDVAIVSENEIVITGRFLDIDQDWWTDYNTATWNGSEWNLSLTTFLSPNEQPTYEPGEGVLAFNSNNVWHLSYYGSLTHRVEDEYILYGFGANDQRGKREIWGLSNNFIVIAGDSSIIHHDGVSFQHHIPMTNSTVHSLFGTGPNNIWAVTYTKNLIDQFDNQLLHFDGQSWNEVYKNQPGFFTTDSISGTVHSVWATGDTVYVPSSSGIWKQDLNANGILIRPQELIQNGIEYFNAGLIHGNHFNDYFVGYADGTLFHYNGENWHFYSELNEYAAS
ncbi:MAG: hypothetical protein H8D23_03435, partial [Candidatus Brocadiales bacterium]|nr:hypothetical protein [Candidatus Brocadiales bacterium]